MPNLLPQPDHGLDKRAWCDSRDECDAFEVLWMKVDELRAEVAELRARLYGDHRTRNCAT